MPSIFYLMLIFIAISVLTSAFKKQSRGNGRSTNDYDNNHQMFMNNTLHNSVNDLNGNGIPDYIENNDFDHNGIPDHMENNFIDSDHDKIPDNIDPDSGFNGYINDSNCFFDNNNGFDSGNSNDAGSNFDVGNSFDSGSSFDNGSSSID